MRMTINIPPELESARMEIMRFFDAMIYKLRRNAHKGKWEGYDMDRARLLMTQELAEMDAAIKEGSSVEVLLESADVANFALILANIAIDRMKGVSIIDPSSDGKTLPEYKPDSKPHTHIPSSYRGKNEEAYCNECGEYMGLISNEL